MKTLSATTPEGEFTRKTAIAYTHIVVRSCQRAFATLIGTKPTYGVHARWYKDRGFVVTWHSSEKAAIKASAQPYAWAESIVLGVYPVNP